ncbi:MAG: metalloregulator ArsR/SmtB family transcription factor, partial [Planctomycetales bacterium]|nr:metalloregulator ArsR/SmtB family transcription factor [Planctomycetales bacterium]
MDKVLQGLRAAGEATRLRLLFVLSHGEFNVTELTQILLQSQPRISRHLKLMTDAGLLSRFKEGSWVVFRLRPDGEVGRLAEMIATTLNADDPVLRGDLARLNEVLAERAARAAEYFSANAA